MHRSLILLTLTLPLVACAAEDRRYPTLLPRAIETQSLAEPVRPAPAATADAALDARISELSTALESARTAFAAASRRAEAAVAVASGMAPGSQPWLDAQGALGAVTATRAPALFALADLERLASDRGVAGLPPYPALEAAVAAARLEVGAQEDRLAMLEASLGG